MLKALHHELKLIFESGQTPSLFLFSFLGDSFFVSALFMTFAASNMVL